MKPIEAGCLAMIVNLEDNAHLNGRVVKVLYFNDLSFGNETGRWQVRGTFTGVSMTGETLYNEGLVRERNLLRIDGDDFSDEDKPYAVKDKDLSHA